METTHIYFPSDPCANGGTCKDQCDEEMDHCFAPNGTVVADDIFCNGEEYCDGAGNIVHPGDPCVNNPNICQKT